METIKGLPEAVEQPTDFAASIVARDESLALYAGAPGLGPPDLCWLQKTAKGSWTASAAEPRGFFHYLLGRDVSSSAAIAAYFAELNSKVEPVGIIQGLWYTAETKVERGFYCCYDPFTRLDVRCELCIPGGVVCGALDADGTVHDVSDQVWRNCVVASFLRHQLYDPELTSHSSLIHRWDVLPSSEGEARLLKAVRELYATRLLPKALSFITADAGGGCTAEHMDIVLHVLLHYFGARHRWQAALDFFTSLQQVYLPAAVYVAAVQRELDSFDASFATLSGAVEASPSEPCLLLALANECLYAEQTDTAAKLARRAVRLQRSLRPAWLLLARCYIRQGLYALALITLNAVPPPPMPASEQEMLLGVAPPDPKYLTKPSLERYDPDLHAARQMSHEEVVADGLRALLYLPAAVMVPREPLDLGPWPDLGPGRLTRAVLAAAYGLLQELVAAIGWDSFLEMRARVFVMQAETAKKPAAPPASPPAQAGGNDSPTFNDALEELAALGMSEYPDDVREARAANLLAAQAAHGADTAAETDALKPTTTEGAGTAAIVAAGNGQAVPAPASAEAAAKEADAAAVAAAAAAAVAAVPAGSLQHGAFGSSAGGVGGGSVSEVVPAEEADVEGVEGAAEEEQEEEQPSGLAGVLASIPGTTALWGMMFGVNKPPAQRPTLQEHQVARLRNVKSIPISRNMSLAASRGLSTQGSIASQHSQPLSGAASAHLGPTAARVSEAGSFTASPGKPKQQPIAEGPEHDGWVGPRTALPPSAAHAASDVSSSGLGAGARASTGAAAGLANVWQSERGPAPIYGQGQGCPGRPAVLPGAMWHPNSSSCVAHRSQIPTQHRRSIVGHHGKGHPVLHMLRIALKHTTHVCVHKAQRLRSVLPGRRREVVGEGKAAGGQLDKQLAVVLKGGQRRLKPHRQLLSLLLALKQLQQQHQPQPSGGSDGGCQLADARTLRLGELLAMMGAASVVPASPPSLVQAVCASKQHHRQGPGMRPGAVCEGLQRGYAAYAGGYSDSDEEDGEGHEEVEGEGLPVVQNSSRAATAAPGRPAGNQQVVRAMLAPQASMGLGPVSTLDADRDFVLLGAAAMEQIEGMQGAKAKRLCVRWLDELIIALWHDLQAYMEWKTLDSELLEVVGNTAAGCVLGLPARQAGSSTQEGGSSQASGSSGVAATPGLDAATSSSSSHTAAAAVVAAATPQASGTSPPSAATILASTAALTAGDWMRRGLLAERLYHDSEALAAYRCCLVAGGAAAAAAPGPSSSTSPPHLLAAQAVMRLAAEAGEAALAAHAVLLVLHWHATKCHATPAAPAPTSPSSGTNRCVFPPTPVACCLGHLNATQGHAKLQALLEEVAAAGLGAGFGGPGATAAVPAHPQPVPELVKSWAKTLAKQLASRG